MQDVGHGGSSDADDSGQRKSRRLRRPDDDFDTRLERCLDQSSWIVDVRTLERREDHLHDAV